jgi:hypothetical protein
MILGSVGYIDSFDDKLILFYDASNVNSYQGSGNIILHIELMCKYIKKIVILYE